MHGRNSFYLKLLVAVLCILGFLVYRDFLSFHHLFIYTDMGKDMMLNVWPNYFHLSEYLRTSGFPTWSFNTGIGSSIFAGSLHRVSLIDPFVLLLMIPSPNNMVFLMPYVLLLKILLAGVLFYLFLVQVKIAQYPAVIGSLLYAFSGYMIIYGGWFDYATEVVFLPILLMAVESLIEDKKNWKYLTLCYAWLALYHPINVYFFAVFPLLYFLVRKQNFKSLINYAKALLLGVGIGFVFFWPNFVTILHSPRVLGGDMNFQTVFHLSSPLEYSTMLGRLFSNDFFGSGSNFKGWGNYLDAPMLYVGLLSLLLIPQTLVQKRRKQKTLPNFLAIFSILYLALPFFRIVLNGFAGDFYRLTGYIVPFAMIYLSMVGLTRVFDKNILNKKLLTLTYFILIAVVAILFFTSKSTVDATIVKQVVAYLTLYYLIFISYSGRIYQSIFKTLLLIAVCTELVVFSRPAVNRPALSPKNLSESIGYNDPSKQLIDRTTANDPGFYRIDKDFASVFCCNDSLMQNYKGTGFYESFGEKGYIDFLANLGLIDTSFGYRAFGLFDDHFYLKELLGVKYGIYKSIEPPVEGYKLISKEGDLRLYENTRFLSAGFVYNKYVSVSDFNKIEKSGDDTKDKILLSAAVLDDSQTVGMNFSKATTSEVLASFNYANTALRNQENSLRVDFSSQKMIKGSVTAQEDGFMFFSIPYNRGWQLIIDDQRVPIQRVNIGFFGAPINKGNHQVLVYYQEPYLYLSLWVSVASIGLFIFLMYRDRKRMS